MQIREANPSDRESIRHLHRDAFGAEGAAVAELAVALLADETALALVAEVDGEVTGNVIFSAARIDDAGAEPAFLLAPVAVAGRHQGRGIGRALIEHGLGMLRERGGDLVFVLGDPRHYRRYGFSAQHRVRAPYDLECPEAWMALSLQGRPLESLGGQLACADPLDRAELW